MIFDPLKKVLQNWLGITALAKKIAEDDMKKYGVGKIYGVHVDIDEKVKEGFVLMGDKSLEIKKGYES